MRSGIRGLFALSICCCTLNAAALKTENVFLIISDGLRWQDVFQGAQQDLMTSASGVKNTNALAREFWRETADERRAALFPFLWNVVAKEGQLFGNQTKGSVVRVSNGHNFSYPGYNEILTGLADPRVSSNEKKPNPNLNVFEWLNGKSDFRGKVAVFATWDVFPYIFNIERSRLPIWPGWDSQFKRFEPKVPDSVVRLLASTTRQWEDVIHDSFVFEAALDYAEKQKPRLLFVGFGETDEWAHSNRYDVYLQAAHKVDNYIRRFWEAAQASNRYRGKTTFIITADHGRGPTKDTWQGHGASVTGSDGDWLAVIGPDTPALGERSNTPQLAHTQIASTIAALLGEGFKSAVKNAGEPIQPVLGK